MTLPTFYKGLMMRPGYEEVFPGIRVVFIVRRHVRKNSTLANSHDCVEGIKASESLGEDGGEVKAKTRGLSSTPYTPSESRGNYNPDGLFYLGCKSNDKCQMKLYEWQSYSGGDENWF